MKKVLISAFFLISFSVETYAKQTQLEEIEVRGKRIFNPTKEVHESVYTGIELTKRGIDITGEKGKNSVYEALNILPGVNYERVDPYNLAGEQGNVRIRGVRGYLGALTVEGIPNWGGNPIGPRAYIYDLNNFSSISLYKGAIPVNIGSGVGNRGGAIELKPAWADDRRSVSLGQSFGSYAFYKTSLSANTGLLPTNTKLYISYSHSQADKWKGPGETGPKNNINFNLVQKITENTSIKFFANLNELTYDKFRTLSYKEVRNLSEFYNLDFNNDLKGNPTLDTNYFKYNTFESENKDMFLVVERKVGEGISFNIKPYLLNEDAIIQDGLPGGATGGRVQKRTRDIDKRGVIADLTYGFKNFKLHAGYHFEASDMDIFTQNYAITNRKTLLYQGYGIKGIGGTSYIKSPFVGVSANFGNTNIQGGLKHFSFEEPYSKGYFTQMVGGKPKLVRGRDLDREERDYDITLPSIGISHSIDNFEIYASYGKNFIRPYAYLPIISLYHNNRTRFQQAKITLNDLFSGYDIEESDNYDFGFRFRHDRFSVNPTIFYTKHEKLLTTVYDPRVRLNYQQNVGEATGYGFEMETNIVLHDNITMYFNPTYTKLTYDDDLVFAGKRLSTKDKQVIDTPKWTLSSGIIFSFGNFNIVPKMTYVGKRYGDAENKEVIGSHTLFDLHVDYTVKKVMGFNRIKFSLDIDNIFDKKYISTINAMDDTLRGSTTYSVGSPQSIHGAITFIY